MFPIFHLIERTGCAKICRKGALTLTKRAQTAIQYTLATHAAEGMTPSKQAVRLCEKIADGRMSADRAVEEIKARYGLRGVARG